MSICILRGDAQDVAQTTTHTVAGTYANGQVYTLTCNLKETTYTSVAGDDNTKVATALTALLNASTIKELKDATFTSALGVITSVSAVAGVPYTFTTSATGTGTFVTAITTAAKGHEHWGDPDNWSNGSVPIAGDDIYLINCATSLKYTLPSTYLVPASIHVDTTFTGDVGLPDQNTAGYYEYRQTYAKIAPTNLYFGENGGVTGGAGSGLFRLDKTTTTSMATQIYQTGQPKKAGQSALQIKGANAADTYVIQQGSVKLTTAQFTTLKAGYQLSPASDVQLVIDSDCVCGAVTQLGGSIVCNANVTSLVTTSGSQGTFYLNGTATMGTATIEGGTYYPKTTGTHTTVSVLGGGKLDHSLDIRSFNINALNLYDGCEFLDPSGTIKGTAGAALAVTTLGNLKNMTTDFGTNKTYSIA